MRARAAVAVPGRVSDAEALWYDPARWPAFLDGFGHLAAIEGDWPGVGARVVWDSTHGGRGRVVERVVAYEVRAGQTVELEDPQVTGLQTVRFTPGRLELELDVALKERNPLVEPFVRRAFRDSLRRTGSRFARELRAELEETSVRSPSP